MERYGAKVGTFHDYLRGVPSLTRISPKGGFKASGAFRPGAAISAVIIGIHKIRVYAINGNNELVETAWNGSWGPTTALTRTATDSRLAAIRFQKEGGGPVNINLFFQPITFTDVLQRWVWDGTKWGPGN
jgi:hypothetical protein